MQNFRFMKLKPGIFAAIMLLISSFIFAGNPHVESVTMNPTNPSFGDAVQVTVTYCGQLYQDHYIGVAISSLPARDNADVSGNGQVFVVSRAGIDVATSQPALTAGGQIGWMTQTQPGAVTADCPTCGSGSNDGKRFTKVYDVHVPPAAYYPGCNVTTLYMHVYMKDNNIGAGEWDDANPCQANPVSITWPIGAEARNFEISKRVEGVLQNSSDLVLYSIDYEYWNGRLLITDAIPGGGNFTLVSWGPQSATGAIISGQAPGATSGPFSWNLRDRTGLPGRATGTVWMLLRMNTNLAAGTRVSNSATGAMTGVTSQNASASIVVGQAAITITKDQSESNPAYGDLITYYLTYQVNGSKLVGYQPFDDIPIGTYGQLSGLGGTPVPGWLFNPQAGTNGEWRVLDECGTGDRVIRGDAGAADNFPSLLFDGLPVTNNMCKGIVMADVKIEPGGYEGADSLVVIRSDGLPNGSAYGLVLSTDDFIGTNSTGNIGFQRCNSGGCIWPLSVNSVTITNNKWWRVKIEAGYPPANNQYAFRAKVWAKGDPEPGWTISWTDPAPPAGFDCNNGQRWRPGIAEQHGAGGDVSDYYDNFIVYEPRVSASTTVWDTVPNASNGDVTYVGQQGPYPYVAGSGAAGVNRWNLGSISDEGGTFTWWGTVNTCNPITNDAWINGAAPMVANQSNQVIAYPVCPTPVITMFKTANVATAAVGQVVTFELWACNSAVGPPTANPFDIWDTIPTYITWGGFVAPAGTRTGSLLVWTQGILAAGACTSHHLWYGTVNGVPMIGAKEYFAVIPDTQTTVLKYAFLEMYGK